jgi:photosynthetic reaction center H subunit
MGTGAITEYIDVAQLAIYAFWIAFAWLIYYLQQESKREGFPLETHLPDGRVVKTPGWIARPDPKTFLLYHGGSKTVPNDFVSPQTLKAAPRHGLAGGGTPLEPTGNPMLDGVGPGSWADRDDVPELTTHDLPLIVPLRAADGFSVAPQDQSPVGLEVHGADGKVAGTVVDLWVDRAEMMFRYLEVETAAEFGPSRRVLLPMPFVRIKDTRGLWGLMMVMQPHDKRFVEVKAILAEQFVHVPAIRNPEQITKLEEEKVAAFYGAGTLYATPQRQEPLF